MATLYKKGNQYHSRFDGVMYDFDIIKSQIDADIDKLLKKGWCKTLPETVVIKPKKAKVNK